LPRPSRFLYSTSSLVAAGVVSFLMFL